MNKPEQGQGEPKPSIVVDSDWKSQVEAEKEALRRQQSAAPEEPAEEAAPAAASPAEPEPAADSPTERDSAAMPQLPPATFPVLVMTLSTQALAALGMAPGPDGRPMSPQLPLAKHFIDTLDMLEQKTRGNLEGEEAALLAESLTQLRLAYVAEKKKSS